MTIRYEMIVYWSQVDKAFVVEVPELPGCMADGATYPQADKRSGRRVFEGYNCEAMMNKISLYLPTLFESERLILRPYQAGDGPAYFAAGQKNRQHLQRYEADNAILSAKTEQQAEALVQELAADWTARNCFFMGAFDKNSGGFVAQVYIGMVNRDTPEFEVGFFVDQDHEGQGYVTEAVKVALDFAFKHLRAQRVSLRCDATNLRSQRVAERCGFTREGLLRQARRQPDGSFSDTLVYGLLRSEWAG